MEEDEGTEDDEGRPEAPDDLPVGSLVGRTPPPLDILFIRSLERCLPMENTPERIGTPCGDSGRAV